MNPNTCILTLVSAPWAHSSWVHEQPTQRHDGAPTRLVHMRKAMNWNSHYKREGGRVKREELRRRNCVSRLDRDPTEEIYIQ